ncbi:histidine-phosphotransfer domain, HPT domain-containing protein [Aspergillus taichungensis]|uniref:Histidine-phosphotransfer domain, HPT domain-containing protein n=1 Tax=Aspergillus taichungensis TaxID=482145 RepID=A0A2J5HH45_9EURO|nr:histidine-phosphotransfer domain, HPT domain-containing protein [Aspergillus taichungensis]
MAPTTTTKTVEGSPVRGETVTSHRREVEANAEQPKEAPTKKKWSDITDSIDKATFDQILEMDDDDDRDFSKGIVFGFFDQAESTFEKMEQAQKDENLKELSQLGHFLKGSSATLGLSKVKEACEKIQHFGNQKDETGSTDEPDDKVSLKNIEKTLTEVKKDYEEVETFLRRYYDDPVSCN